MTALALRLLEHVHGHLGWLSVAALSHPAILLRNPKRRARLSVSVATAFVVITALMGGVIYPHYRDLLKQQIFIEAPRTGWMFERKEHLAVGAVAFALVGCISHLTMSRVDGDETQRMMARLAHRAFVVSFALALAVAGLGVVVATYRTF